jgi:predicted ATPase
MLTHLHVEHYRSIAQCDIGLGTCNVFVGANESGKSNVIDAIRFMRDAVSHGLDRAIADRHGIESIKQWSPSRRYHVTVCLKLGSPASTGEYRLTISSRKETYQIIRETGFWTRAFRVRTPIRSEDPTAEQTTIARRQTVKFDRSRSGKVEIEFHRDGDVERASLPTIDVQDDIFLRQPFGAFVIEDPNTTNILARASSLLSHKRREISNFDTNGLNC